MIVSDITKPLSRISPRQFRDNRLFIASQHFVMNISKEIQGQFSLLLMASYETFATNSSKTIFNGVIIKPLLRIILYIEQESR